MPCDYSKLRPVDNDAMFWSPKDVGAVLQGTLVAVQWVFNQGMAGQEGSFRNRYTIRDEAGKHFMSNAPSIDRQMQTVSVGQYVKIIHEGLQAKKRGPGQFRAYKVMAVPGMVNEEWLAQNQKNLTLLDCRLKGSNQHASEPEIDVSEAMADDDQCKPVDPIAEFGAELERTAAVPESKEKRILDIAILKYGAKSADEAKVKVVMATGFPFQEAYYDQILAKLS